MALQTYSIGTASVATGDDVIVGTGTMWDLAKADDRFVDMATGNFVLIKDRIDGTHLSTEKWPHPSMDGNYAIVYRSMLRLEGGEAWLEVERLLASLKVNGLIYLVGPDEAAPPVGDGREGQYARQPSTGKEWEYTGGEWVFVGISQPLGPIEVWDSATTYHVNSFVKSAGSVYLGRADSLNKLPADNPAEWELLSSKGDKGDRGDDGEDGEDGAAATISVGTVTSLPYGTPASFENVGTPNAAIFDIGIPKGQNGTGTGDMQGANNLSDLTDSDAALDNLGGTTTGKALFKASSPSVARAAVGAASSAVELNSLIALMYASMTSAAPVFTGVGFADSFDTLSFINAPASSSMDTTTAGIIKPTSDMISGATGTSFGGFTAQGGIAAAFDGTTSQSQALCAAVNPSFNGFSQSIGKDWGSGNTKIVGRFRIYGPNDNNFLGAGGGTTCKLQGSNDDFVSQTVDLTGVITLPAGSSQVVDVRTGIDLSTAYRYHRVIYYGNGVNTLAVAEQQFYSFDAPFNLVVYSAAVPVGLAPASVVVAARTGHYGTVAPNVDYFIAASRDDAAFTTGTLTDVIVDPSGPAHIILTKIDLGSQPPGSTITLKFSTGTNKPVDIRDWAFLIP